jgi:hypothetical protein
VAAVGHCWLLLLFSGSRDRGMSVFQKQASTDTIMEGWAGRHSGLMSVVLWISCHACFCCCYLRFGSITGALEVLGSFQGHG